MKKKLAATLSVVLILGLAALGILAYLTDTDSDVNVMTLGNVDIEQHEYQRATNKDGTYNTDTIDNQTSYVLEAFEQAKPLYPAIIPNGGTVNGVKWGYDHTGVRMTQVGSYGTASVFNTPNAQDKFVTVENTGKSDAYVRTLIAFEIGEAELVSEEFPDQDLISAEIRAEKNKSGEQPWTYGFMDYVEIDNNKYFVYELIYTGAKLSTGTWRHANGVLPAGDTTYPNLCQVYMASRATNEDVEAIDGNGNGTYDILVLSQAVQVEGFADAQTALDTAFGDVIEAKVVEWFGGMEIPEAVDTADELAAAIAAGNDVALTADITTKEIVVPAGTSVTVDMNGHNLIGKEYTTDEGKRSRNNVFDNNGNLTISGDGHIRTRNIKNEAGAKLVIDGDIEIVGGVEAGGSAIWNEGDCVINGATISQANDWNYAVQNVTKDATMVIKNAKVSANHGAISNTGENTSLVIDDGTFECTASGHVVYVSNGVVTINGGTFKHLQQNATAEGNVVIYSKTGSVVVNGGIFDSVNAALKYNTHNSNITINNGTFLNEAKKSY